MEYKRFGDTIIARIDKGEEIVEKLTELAVSENIALASVSALGAVNSFTVGAFRPEKKKYESNDFRGDYEIVSLTGTVTAMGGAPYLHLHMSAGNVRSEVVGGHLNRARVSATCEMVISVVDGAVNRRFDEAVGLNIMDF